METVKTQRDIDEKGRQFGPTLISIFVDPTLKDGVVEPTLIKVEVDSIKIDLQDGEQGIHERVTLDIEKSLQEGIITPEAFQTTYDTIQLLIRGVDWVAKSKSVSLQEALDA